MHKVSAKSKRVNYGEPNRFKNNVTLFYFYFCTISRKKCITLAYFPEIASKFKTFQGFKRKTPLEFEI